MKSFSLTLSDAVRTEYFDSVIHFIGTDESGSFGILPQHRKMIAVLRYGLARFMGSNGDWHYLALPGGVMRFADNAMAVVTMRYFLGTDRDAIADQLAAELAREDSELHAVRVTMTGIERTLMRRLNELSAQKQEQEIMRR